jgi:hypothetical protein
MLPPPAPMVRTSTIGTRTGSRKSSSTDSASCGRPCSEMPTSKLVPPMSAVTIRSNPAWEAIRAAAITPAAGPERIMCAARSPIRAAGTAPPLDCMISASLANPQSESLVTSRSA